MTSAKISQEQELPLFCLLLTELCVFLVVVVDSMEFHLVFVWPLDFATGVRHRGELQPVFEWLGEGKRKQWKLQTCCCHVSNA